MHIRSIGLAGRVQRDARIRQLVYAVRRAHRNAVVQAGATDHRPWPCRIQVGGRRPARVLASTDPRRPASSSRRTAVR